MSIDTANGYISQVVLPPKKEGDIERLYLIKDKNAQDNIKLLQSDLTSLDSELNTLDNKIDNIDIPNISNLVSTDDLTNTVSGLISKKETNDNYVTWSSLLTYYSNNATLKNNYAHITDGIIDNATINHEDVNGLSENYAHIAQGKIINAVIDYNNVNGLNENYAHITDGIINNATINYTDINDLNDHYASISNGIIDNASIDYTKINNLNDNYAHITNGSIDNATISHQKIEDLGNNYAHIANGIIDNANIDYANVNNLNTNYAHITDGTIDNANIDYAKVNNLDANYAHIENGVIDNATIDQAKVNNLDVNYAHIQNGVIDNANIDQANINNLDANYAHITNGTIDNANISYANVSNLNAHYAHLEDGVIDNALIGYANVDQLDSHYAEIDMANVNNAWIENGVIKDAAISDAKILGVSANKLTAGKIDAANINVINLRADNLIVTKINGQPVIGGYTLVDPVISGYIDKNPSQEKWYEFYNNLYTLTVDTVVDPNKNYYTTSDSVELYDQATIDGMLENINARIDSQIETWTVDELPTLNNYPANQWNTNKLKDAHIGDICYVVNAADDYNGYTYRFAYDNKSQQYSWILIQDNDTAATLGRITQLEEFNNQLVHWEDATDEGVTTVRGRFTELSGRIDKVVKSSIQLWHTAENTTLPDKPTAAITSVSTEGNIWTSVVPIYNANYPYYFYCWQYQYEDESYDWSAVVYDQATTEAQERARTGIANAATAQSTAEDNIRSSVQLWFTKKDKEEFPNKPTSQVTNNSATGNTSYNRWNLVVPTYNIGYPYYFYCYQQQKGDGTYQWTDVVYDDITSAAMETARSAISTFETFEQTTFKEVTDTIDTQGTTITQLQTATEKALSQGIEYIVGTHGTTATSNWTGVTQEEQLYTGKQIAYYMTSAGVSNNSATLNLQLSDGTWSGPINVKINNTDVTDQYPKDTVIKLTYDGGAWKSDNYNSDTNYYDREAYKASVTANGAISAGRIGVFGTDGKLKLLSNSAFDTSYPILYIGTAYTTNTLTQTNNYTFWGTPFNLTNTHAITGAAAGKPVYIVGALNGNIMTPTSEVLTCTEPTGENGLFYLRLGLMSTASNAVLESQHPIYAFMDGKFQQTTQSVVTVSNTVNTVKQTADTNKASITSLTQTVSDNKTAIETRASTIEQNLSGITTRVGSLESTTTSQGTRLTNAETAIEQNAEAISLSAQKVSSRGLQLVTNGNGFMGNNTNWPTLTFDGSVSNGSPGSFTRAVPDGYSKTVVSDEPFPIDPSKEYIFEFDAMSDDGTARLCSFLLNLDTDEKNIGPQNVFFFPNTLTTLASDLNPGDTTIKLTSAANWASTSADHQRAIVFWDYQNSYGYLYPEETYSRHFYSGIYSDDSKVNKSTGVITLKSAWTGPKKLAGTKVSQSCSGNAYNYAIRNALVPNTWTHYSFVYSGMNIAKTGNDVNGKFRQATAFAKVGFLWNYSASMSNPQGQLWVTNISVKENVATQTALAAIKVTTDGISSTVEKIRGVKYLTSSSSGASLANIQTYSAEGTTDTWAVTPGTTSDIRVGDTIYLQYKDTTRNCYVYIKGTVNSFSNHNVNFTAHGYEDVLPVATIISTINQSAETVKIKAEKVEIDGTAVFSAISSDVDDAITDKGYATTTQAQGYATTAKTEAVNAAAADATSKANDAQSAAEATASADATQKANAAQSAAISAAATDATEKANAARDAAISAAATDATNKVNAVNKQEQLVYIQAVSGTLSIPDNKKPTTWVTNTGESVSSDEEGLTPVWTTKRPTYRSKYPVLFVATQRQTVGGTLTCTTPLKDDTTTVIDGGHITTGKIDATTVDVTNINASEIVSGSLTSTNYQEAATSGVPYSVAGSKIELSTGNIYTPSFGVINDSTNANYPVGLYINDGFVARSGKIGWSAENYWDVGTLPLNSGTYTTGIVATGNSLINVGELILESNRDSNNNASLHTGTISKSTTAYTRNYLRDPNNHYRDYGLQAPVLDSSATNYTSGVDDNFLYIKKSPDTSVPSLEKDWDYLFRVDKDGNVYTSGAMYINGELVQSGGNFVKTSGNSTINGSLTITNGTLIGALNKSITFTTSGGAAAGSTYNGSNNLTVSYTTIGAAAASHTHSNYAFTAGTGLSLNGTQFYVSSANVSTMMNLLGEGTSPANRNDYAIVQYANGGTTTTTYHRRKLSNVFAALNSSDITTALGFTPYNATNPNGYTSNTGTVTSIKLIAGGGISLDTDNTAITTSGSRTISHADTSSQGSITASDRTYIKSVTLDTYGHVTGLTTGTETVTNTHNTAYLYAGASNGSANAATTNGNTYLILKDGDSVTSRRKISGSGTVSVTSDASGNISIAGTAHPTTLKNPNAIKINVYNGSSTATTTTYDGGTANQSVNVASNNALTGVSASTSGGKTTFTLTTATGATSTFDVNVTGAVVTGATTLTKSDGTAVSAGGATTKPVYFSEGLPIAVTSIPYSLLTGTPTFTLNGSAVTSPSWYAPTAAGATTQVLIGGGNSAAPTWKNIADLTPSAATKATNDSDGNPINTTYLKKSGGTLTGAINIANNIWNKIGDDVQIGDINEAGTLGIQGVNGNTAIRFTTYNQTTKTTGGKISWDGTNFTITGTVNTSISGNAATASAAPWSGITDKPATATRWPAWNEISQSGANNIEEGASDLTDNSEILTSYASNNGFADSSATGKVYRRDAIHVYNYIKGKTDNVYVKKSGDTMTGHLITTNLGIVNTSSTAGNGISLYNGGDTIAKVWNYGIAFAGTGKYGKHGAVQGDWATYFTMSGANNRGWIFKHGGEQTTSGNVASISGQGKFQGLSYNVAGHCNLEYNTTTESLDFIFV